MKKFISLTFISLISIKSFATINQVEIETSTINSQFFIAILSGVLLALIFQVILTALSVAMGITMIGNVKKTYVKNKVEPSGDNNDNITYNQDYDSGTSTGVKISAAFGIWSLLTTAISLFGASALALNLSFFGSVASNLTVALVIWALFFLILFYLETRIVNTAIGGLVTTATSGLKSSGHAIKQLFSKSDEQKTQSTIDNTVEKIRKEFDVNLNTSELSNVVDKFFNKAHKKLPNYETLITDLESIAQKSQSKNTSGKYMAIQQVLSNIIDKADKSESKNTDGKIDQLKTLLSELKDKYNNNANTADGIKDIIEEYTELEKSEVDDKINQVESYLSSVSPEHFSENNLNETIQNIVSNPNSATTLISNKFKNFDRNKIIELLSKNTNLDTNELNNYAELVDQVIKDTRKKIDSNNLNSIKENAQNSIEQFLNTSDQNNLNYDDLAEEINAIYNNPKDSFSIIKSRLSKIDADTVKAIITNNKYIDKDQIDSVTSNINKTIDNIKSQVSSIEKKANEQLEMTKRKAVIQAEHARKTAASAAWWLVITVIISGGAAMLGAWLELA